MTEAAKILGLARTREESWGEGRITFEVTLSDYPDSEFDHKYMFSETTSPVLIDYLWTSDNKFKIILRRGEHIIRTIVADGTKIDTGDGRIWDAKFLDEPSEFPSEELGYEYFDLLWPRISVIFSHVFPVTKEISMSTKLIPYIGGWLVRSEEESTGTITLEFRNLGDKAFYELVLDPKRGYIPILFARLEKEGDYTWTSRYSDPFIVGDDQWLAGKLEKTFGNSDENAPYLISRVVKAEVLAPQSIDPKEFQIDERDSEFIRWGESQPPSEFVAFVDDAFRDGYNPSYILVYLYGGSFVLLLLALTLKLTRRLFKRRIS